MTVVVYVLAVIGAAAVLLVAWLLLPPSAVRNVIGCPGTPAGAIALPESHASDLADLLNAADALNRRGECVIEGGWSETHRQFYLTVQRPGDSAQVRRFSSPEMRALSR